MKFMESSLEKKKKNGVGWLVGWFVGKRGSESLRLTDAFENCNLEL